MGMNWVLRYALGDDRSKQVQTTLAADTATRESSTIRPMLQLERIQKNNFPASRHRGCKEWQVRLVANYVLLFLSGHPEYQPTKEDNHHQHNERQYFNHAQ
tara:strand:- start:300 stop:602 length:303 start_codon:yes stop_codon:yes gene_type:complete